MMDDRLDALLSAPLPAVEDRGFSARIVAGAFAARERRAGLELLGLLAAAGVLLAFLPLTALADMVSDTIDYVTGNLGNSLPIAMAALAIVLSFSFARIMAD
jgi:hypothetical protein